MRLTDALQSSGSLEIVGDPNNSREKVEAWVARGTADAGIILPSGARALDDIGGLGESPILLITDPVRKVTLAMLSGQIQKAYFEALPDVALGSVVTVIEDQFVELNDEQRADIAAGLVEIRDDTLAGRQSGWSFEEMIESRYVAGTLGGHEPCRLLCGGGRFSVSAVFLHAGRRIADGRTRVRNPGAHHGRAGWYGRAGQWQISVSGGPGYRADAGHLHRGVADLWSGSAGAMECLVCGHPFGLHCREWHELAGRRCVSYSQSGAQLMDRAGAAVVRHWWQHGAEVFHAAVGYGISGGLRPNTWVLEAYSALFWRNSGLGEVILPCGLLMLLGLAGLLAAQWLAVRRARI